MKPWVISGISWTPNAIEARQILLLVREATGIQREPTLQETPPRLQKTPPRLEVTRFEIGDGALRAGDGSTVRVQIANRGERTAYGVIATTNSGIKSLHGQQLSFGDVPPGTEELRHFRLTVPASETSPDTMLVLIFKERYGFSPPNVSRRFRIDAAKIAPVLAVHCSIPGRSPSQPDLDAGEDVVLRCLVSNSGSGAAMVELVTSLAGAAPVQWTAQSVAPRSQVSFEVPIRVPRQLAIDSAVEIEVIARDHEFAREARTALVGVIRKPKLCTPGELTHEHYRVKLTKLRAALADGELTQSQFDGYDAELVACLK